MHDRLRQLGELLHPQRIRSERTVASLAQSHVEQHFMRALERRVGRQA